MNDKKKRAITHGLAFLIGLMFASCVKSPRMQIVERPVEVIKEVPKEVYVDRVVEKVVTKVKIKEVVVPDHCHVVVRITTKEALPSHRLSLMAGYGPTGSLRTEEILGGYKVSIKKGPVVGVGYQYRLFDTNNVGLQVQSNGAILGTFGKDF